MDDLDLVSQTTTNATAYSFRFKWGWAIFTLNDRTGELSIHSDWGTYGHRWHIGALGEGHTLHTFLAQCDGDYVTRKLALDTQSKCLERVLDPEGTLREVTEAICLARREQSISKDKARYLLQDARKWTSGEDELRQETCPNELDEFLGHESYEYIRRKDSARFVFLRNKLWPFFTKWLRENLVSKQAEVANA